MKRQGYPDTEAADERLATGYTGRLFLAISIGWFGVAIGRQVLPPLLPAIMGDLGITPFQAGAVLTVLWATFALNHYPGGRFADRLSRKTVLVGGLITLAVGFFLLTTAVTYSLLVFAAAVAGTGAGLYFIAMRTITADLYVNRRAQAFGLQAAIGRVGSTLAAGLAVLVLAVGIWQSSFLPMVLLFVGIAVALHCWIREPYVLKRVDLGIFDTGSRVFARAETRRILVSFMVFSFTIQGTTGFLPTFLQAEKGFSPTLASAGFATFFIVSVGVAPLAGAVGDRYSKLPVTVTGLVIAVIGLSALLLVDSGPAVGVSIVALSVGLWSFPSVMQAYLMDTFDDASMGGDLGAFKTVYTGIGSLGPSYVGFVAGGWSYTAAYVGVIGALLLALVMVVWVWHGRRQ